MLNAVNNMIKSSAGVIAPPLGVLIKSRTESYRSLFWIASVGHALSSIVFALWAQVEPAPRFRDDAPK